MNEKKLLIEGYQPVVKVQDGYQPVTEIQKGYQPNASVQKVIRGNTNVSTPVVMVNITPPKGGTGEVKKK